MTSWRVEFPDFKAEDLPALPPGFEDWSWHNDAAPSFANLALGIQIYVNPVAPSEREIPDMERFALFGLNADGTLTKDEPILCTDDWNAVLHKLADVKNELERQTQ